MMSPTFECSLEGLRSAVRLRYVVWGNPDPDLKTEHYMSGYPISEKKWDQTETIRSRIKLLIRDIEIATAADQRELAERFASQGATTRDATSEIAGLL